jgi:hypothetical protein
MNVKGYTKKYLNDFNKESFLIDLCLEGITRIELAGKFEIPFKTFSGILDELSVLYKEVGKNINHEDVILWNIFKTEYWEQIKNKLFYKYDEGNKVIWTNNLENRVDDDCDFLIFWVDEWHELFRKEYVHDVKCFDILDCEFFNEIEVIKAYQSIVEESKANADGLFIFTLSKNRALFIINHEPPKTQKEGIKVNPPKPPVSDNLPKPKSQDDKPLHPGLSTAKVVLSDTDPHISTIKDMLIENLKAIKDGKINVDQANAFNATVQTFINMSKTQLEYLKFLNNLK